MNDFVKVSKEKINNIKTNGGLTDRELHLLSMIDDLLNLVELKNQRIERLEITEQAYQAYMKAK